MKKRIIVSVPYRGSLYSNNKYSCDKDLAVRVFPSPIGVLYILIDSRFNKFEKRD